MQQHSSGLFGFSLILSQFSAALQPCAAVSKDWGVIPELVVVSVPGLRSPELCCPPVPARREPRPGSAAFLGSSPELLHEEMRQERTRRGDRHK